MMCTIIHWNLFKHFLKRNLWHTSPSFFVSYIVIIRLFSSCSLQAGTCKDIQGILVSYKIKVNLMVVSGGVLGRLISRLTILKYFCWVFIILDNINETSTRSLICTVLFPFTVMLLPKYLWSWCHQSQKVMFILDKEWSLACTRIICIYVYSSVIY